MPDFIINYFSKKTDGSKGRIALDAIFRRVQPMTATTESILNFGVLVPFSPSLFVATGGSYSCDFSWIAPRVNTLDITPAIKIYEGAVLVATITNGDLFYHLSEVTPGEHTYSIVAEYTLPDDTIVTSIPISSNSTLVIALEIPTNLSIVENKASVTLSWTGTTQEGRVSYRVRRDDTILASPTGTTYTDASGESGTLYTYYVTAVYADDIESYSISINGRSYGPGSGTEADPYNLDSPSDITALATTYNVASPPTGKYYKLRKNINMSGVTMTPIGLVSTDGFQGHFDGNGMTISNISMTRSSDYAGLFAKMTNSEIKDLGLVNATVSGGQSYSCVGRLAAKISNTVVTNCYCSGTGTVSGGASIGGLIGRAELSSIITFCANTATSTSSGIITAYNSSVGGLVGYLSASSISKSYSNASVSLINSGLTYAYGGGLVGDAINGNISDCYATGSVSIGSSAHYGGGLVGYANTGTTITYCYSIGQVSGTGTYILGLIGRKNAAASVLYSFWNTETSGKSTSSGGTGKTTTLMKTLSTYTDATWDFSTIWNLNSAINNGYPFLRN